MSNFPVVRAKSVVSLPRQRDLERGDSRVATLTRVTSVPNIASLHVRRDYQPSTLYKYRRDWDSLDDHYYDRYTMAPALYWADFRYQARRQTRTDPIPNSLGLDYPAFWTRYKWYADYLNPEYWRKYRNPFYDRPLWDSWRPYLLDRVNQKHAIDLYRKGIISFQYLDRKWITPWALGRDNTDWADVYQKAGRYGPRRYFYSFAA